MRLVPFLTIAFILYVAPTRVFAGTVYVCDGKPLESRTLVRLGYAFAKDSRRVCYFDQELKGLNSRSLKVRRGGIATDGKRVFVHSRAAPGVDPGTLEYMGYRYYRDARRVYVRDSSGLRVLDGMDPSSFHLHGAYYTSDKSGVYWNGFRVLAADRRTFRVTSLHGARDQYRTFKKGVPVGP